MREQLARAWRGYWSAIDARISIEVLRIAMAVGGLWVWSVATVPSYQALLDRYPAGAYQPLGILWLFGSEPPPVWVLEACKVAGLIALVCMAIGLFTRASIAVSALCCMLLAGLRDGFHAPWSHSYVPFLLAQLAFLFAPAGRWLSVDAAIRRARGRPRLPAVNAAWTVLLVQVAVALPFFNAVHWKLRRSGLTWALSDTLRHHILTAFDWAGEQRTALADLVIRHEAAWKAAALGNLVSQLLPMVACFMVRRPRLRALLGLFYLAEVVALDQLMGLPNYHWLPLAVVFVDWDRLVARLRRAPAPEPPPEVPPPPRAASIFIAGFLLANLVVAFAWPNLDVRMKIYPLSQYRMFSIVRAKKPYDVHQSWEFDALRFEVDPATRNRAQVERLFDKRFRKHHAVRDRKRVKRLLDEARRVRTLRSVTVHFSILQAPPHPAAPDLERHDAGVLARYRGDAFQSVLGTAGVAADGGFYIEPAPVGLSLPAAPRVSYILDQDPAARPIEVVAQGGRYHYRPREAGRHIFLVDVAGERFVVAEVSHATSDTEMHRSSPPIR